MLKDEAPAAVAIFEKMMADDHNSRPTAGEALAGIRACEKTLSRAQLDGSVPEPDLPNPSISEMVRHRNELMERKEARLKARALQNTENV